MKYLNTLSQVIVSLQLNYGIFKRYSLKNRNKSLGVGFEGKFMSFAFHSLLHVSIQNATSQLFF